MKIKAKISPSSRKWVTDQEARYAMALVDLEEEHKDNVEKAKAKLRSFRKFWASNTLPVYEYHKPRVFPDKEAFVIERKWTKFPMVNVNTLRKQEHWACPYCKQEPGVRSEDDGRGGFDYTYVCNCKGARKHGKKYKR